MKARDGGDQLAGFGVDRSNEAAIRHLCDLGMTKSTAAKLTMEVGIAGLINFSEHELRVFGLSKRVARRVRAACELMRLVDKPQRININDAEAAYMLLRPLIAFEEQEEFVTLGLDVRNQLVGIVRVARGSVHGVEVHPREVFKSAIRMAASAVIVAHNHPSNDSTPSPEDIALTGRLRSVGDMVGIPVIDHVVVARDGFTSIARYTSGSRTTGPEKLW